MAKLSHTKDVNILLTVFVIISTIQASCALTCLQCDNAKSLRDCERFTDCAHDEACFIEKYLNEKTFEFVHRAGCRNVKDCKLVECNKQFYGTTESTTSNPATLSSQNPPLYSPATTKHARFKRDLVVCTQCCYNDTCNTNGCGSSYYSENETTLHCFEKDKVTTNETVQTVKVCQTNELCSHTYKIFTGKYGYQLGCLSKRFCDFLAQTAINEGRQPDTMCCDKPLCNVNPYAQTSNASSISQLLACPTAIVKPTTTTTVAPTTPPSNASWRTPTTPQQLSSSTASSTTSTSTQKTTTPTQPSTSATQPSTSTTQPSTSTTQSPTSTTQPSTSTTQSSTSTTQPSTSTTQPSTSTIQPSTVTTQPSTRTTQPSTSTTQPSTSTTQVSTSTTQVSTSTTQPSTSTTQPSTSTTQPSTSVTQPSTSTTQTSTSTTQPSTSTTQPLTSTTQPSTSTTQPSTSTTQPSTSTTQPSTSTTQPSTSTTQPSTSTTQPSTSTTQPSTSTTQPSTSTTQSSTSTSQPSTSTTQILTGSTSPQTPLPAYVTIKPNTPQLPIIKTPTASSSNVTSSVTTQTAFTPTPNTTMVPQTTTLKDIITLPPTTTRCFKCAGPPESCDLAIYEDDCLAPDNYCINHVINKASGQKLIERGCGNVQRCYKDWYLGSSDDDKCRQLTGGKVLTYDFECTYCCTKDSCNYDLHPKQDTLYSPTK